MAVEVKEAGFMYHLQDHGNKLLNSLHHQWKESKHCDLVILAQDKPLAVHACVMSAFSPRIASLISDSQSPKETVESSSKYSVEVVFHCEVIESVLTAVYTGVFQPPSELLKEVHAAVQWLEIEELAYAIKKQTDDLAEKIHLKTTSDDSLVSLAELTSCVVQVGQDLRAYEAEDKVADRDEPSSSRLDIGRLVSDAYVKQPVNQIIMIPRIVIDRVNEKMLGVNVKMDIDSPCSDYPQVFTIQEVKQETDEVNVSDIQVSSAPQQKKGQRTRSSKQVSCQECIAEPSKSEKKLSKAKAKIYKPKLYEQKSSHKKAQPKSLKNLADKSADKSGQQDTENTGVDNNQNKTTYGIRESVESAVIEEIQSDDPVKCELDLIVGNVKVIKCTKCYAKFSDLNLYESHIGNHPTFTCDKCDASYFSKFTLAKHVHSVHVGLDHLVCRHCSFQAKSQVQLRRHAADAHNDKKPFSCHHEGCKFSAVKHHAVLKHMVVHSKVKEYMCDKCSMTFSRPISLTLHQRACYQLQEYLCDFCGQGFNHLQSMKKHRQVIHFGEKPYKCSVCSSTFGDHRNLRRHMLIHENSFPYTCPACKQQFRHSNSLKSHVATKHKVENIQLNLSRNMPGTLGGLSYKRILKNDLINAMTGKVRLDGDRSSKKRGSRKRRFRSPSHMFDPAAFTQEFFVPPEDSNFEVNSSNDLEFAVSDVHDGEAFAYTSTHLNLPRESLADAEEDSGELSHETSDVSMSSLLMGQMPSTMSDSWAEKVRSPQQLTVKLSELPSLGSSNVLVASTQNRMPSVVNTSAQTPFRTMSVPDISRHEVSRSHGGTQKLQQSSQQALEKFLAQNYISSSSLPAAAVSDTLGPVAVSDTSSALPSPSQQFQNSLSTQVKFLVSTKARRKIVKQACSCCSEQPKIF